MIGTLGVVLVIVATACSGSDPGSPPAHEDRPRCELGFSPPDGFRPTEESEDPYEDHVGVRAGFADDLGRELHYFAGIPGEFGEGLPVAGHVPVAVGLAGVLQGEGRVWVLSWRAPGPCGVRAALGSGFSQRGFLSTLEGAGAIPTR